MRVGLLFAMGDPLAPEAAREHLTEHPRDIGTAIEAWSYGQMQGGRGRMKAEEQALKRLVPVYGDADPHFDAIRAFALAEVGEALAARPLAERALERRPRSGLAMHALVHALHPLEPRATLADALVSWLPGYDGFLRRHLAWHVALCELDSGRLEAARRWYLDEVALRASEDPDEGALVDAADLACRAACRNCGWADQALPAFRKLADHVAREEISSAFRWSRSAAKVLRRWSSRLSSRDQLLGGFYLSGAAHFFAPVQKDPLVTLSALAVQARTSGLDAADALLRAIERHATLAETTEAIVALARALRAHAAGQPREVLRFLETLEADAVEELGGSTVNHELFADLMDHARRTTTRPDSGA